METLFNAILDEVILYFECLRSAVGYWEDDETMPEGVRHITIPGYYEFRPRTIYPENAEYAKFLNSLSVRFISIGGRYVPCDYGCGKWLFFSYGEEDNWDHRYHTDVFGCSHCEAKAYEEEFGEDASGWYDYSL